MSVCSLGVKELCESTFPLILFDAADTLDEMPRMITPYQTTQPLPFSGPIPAPSETNCINRRLTEDLVRALQLSCILFLSRVLLSLSVFSRCYFQAIQNLYSLFFPSEVVSLPSIASSHFHFIFWC